MLKGLCFLCAICVASAGPTRLSALLDSIQLIKSATIEEAHELETQNRNQTTQMANIIADGTAQLTVVTNQLTDLNSKIAAIETSVLPELDAKKNLTNSEVAALKAEMATAQSDRVTAAQKNLQNIEGLSADMDTLTQLAQKIAEVVRSADSVVAASKTFANIATRSDFTGNMLSATCSSQEEISNTLGALLQHVTDTQNNEMKRAQQIDQSYVTYIASLQQQLDVLANTSAIYSARQAEALQQRGNLQLQIADLMATSGQMSQRLTKLQGLSDWMANTLAARESVIAASVEKCNAIIQQLTLLQAKLAVRSVTTQ